MNNGIVRVRGTLFIDIDGTLLNTSTDEPNPGAVEKINKAFDSGFMIILTTLRCRDMAFMANEADVETLALLTKLDLKYHTVIWGTPSPRIIINDEGAQAINHPTDGSWENYEF